MLETLTDHLAWALLGLYLAVSRVLHERTGKRIGGLLVLPVLLAYAFFDPPLLLIFLIATVTAYSTGLILAPVGTEAGPRTLYLYLILGLAASGVWNFILGSPLHALTLAFLPGLFAYNLHREGLPRRERPVLDRLRWPSSPR